MVAPLDVIPQDRRAPPHRIGTGGTEEDQIEDAARATPPAGATAVRTGSGTSPPQGVRSTIFGVSLGKRTVHRRQLELQEEDRRATLRHYRGKLMVP